MFHLILSSLIDHLSLFIDKVIHIKAIITFTIHFAIIFHFIALIHCYSIHFHYLLFVRFFQETKHFILNFSHPHGLNFPNFIFVLNSHFIYILILNFVILLYFMDCINQAYPFFIVKAKFLTHLNLFSLNYRCQVN